MEGKEGRRVNGEKTTNTVVSPSHPRKTSRNHTSISSSASLSSPLTLNPRDSPEFFTCHCCGIVDDGLRALESQWRLVLVCKGCHDRIRSAAVCSYCFNTRDVDVLVCRRCLCRVHLRCVHVQRGYITLSEFDPISFTCIDCCAIPRPQFQNMLRSRSLWEDLVRSVSSSAKKKVSLAAKARSKALKKADDARVAMELAFDAIMYARDAAVADEQLAGQLHRAMNGSTRVLRRTHRSSLGNFVPVKEECGNGVVSSVGRKPCNLRGGVHKKLGICRKDDDVFGSNKTSLSEKKSSMKPGISVKKELLKVDAHYARVSTEANLTKKRRHFNMVLNCDEAINNDGLALISCRESADSNSLMEISECGTCAGEDSSNLQKGCTVPGHNAKILLENF